MFCDRFEDRYFDIATHVSTNNKGLYSKLKK